MSEDRLEQALEALKNENANDGELAGAHDRVWAKLTAPGESLCAEFQLQFRDYADGQLEGKRRLLMEDHLSRCPNCRASLAGQKESPTDNVVPIRRASRWPRWGNWAAAAAVLLSVLYLGRGYIDTMLAMGSPRATVVSVSGSLYRIPQGVLAPGAAIGEEEVVRTGPGARAILKLADGSLVDVNERTELSVHAAWSGRIVRLQRGDIIVRAAKQRHGYLRVQTRDSLASVKGTIFAVSSGLSGTVVSVIEGSVAVAQSGAETLLSPGEQSASNDALLSSAQDAVAWSPDAETYVGMLASLAHIQEQVAALSSPSLGVQSRMLQHLPPNTVLFGAIPNFGDKISQAMGFAEQQSAENPAFGQWWGSSSGQSLKRLLGRVETIAHLFGNEIVFAFSTGLPGTNDKIPMVFAEVAPGKNEELRNALDSLTGQIGATALPYNLTENLLVLSDSAPHLQLLLNNLGKGVATSFTEEIAERYQRGVGWMLGMDLESMVVQWGAEESTFVKTPQVKHLFLERRNPQGAEENTVTVSFMGPRMGLASFLANSGSGGAAEYLSSDVFAAGYVSTREPKQMFEELLALITRSNPSALSQLSQAESALGLSFASDFAASIGTESAFAIDSLSTKGPVWILAAMVNDPATLDTSIRKIVDVWNAENAKAGRTERIVVEQETVNGKAWTSMKLDSAPLTITWTYDLGYMVASSDRAAALRAIATRNGGSPLIWSQAFQQQLAGQDGLHPSGFAWLNTKGVFQSFAGMVQNPATRNLLAERDPILILFNAGTEQIRAVSRTRLSGMIMDMLLMQGLSQMQGGSQPTAGYL
jgi:hypothetical protein